MLLRQLLVVLAARRELANLYRSLGALTGTPNYEHILAVLRGVDDNALGSDGPHEFLATLYLNIQAEVHVLLKCIEAQEAVAQYKFTEAVFITFQCKEELENWKVSELLVCW